MKMQIKAESSAAEGKGQAVFQCRNYESST